MEDELLARYDQTLFVLLKWLFRPSCTSLFRIATLFGHIQPGSEDAAQSAKELIFKRAISQRVSTCLFDQIGDILLAKACRLGWIPRIDSIARIFPALISQRAAREAVMNKHLHVLNWLLSRGIMVSWSPQLFVVAAQNGTLSIIRWLASHFDLHHHEDIQFSMFAASIGNGHNFVTQWLWIEGLIHDWNTEVLEQALALAPGTTIQWMISQNTFRRLTISLDIAATNGDLTFLEVTKRFAINATTAAMDNAAANNHLDVVKWLHYNRNEGCTNAAMDNAAKNGHIEVVRWLNRERPEKCSSDAGFQAAVNGHLYVLTFLYHARVLILPDNTFANVCASGHLHVARWLSKHRLGGGSFNAMNWAASLNHMNVLKWLHIARYEGCTTAAMDGAAENGHLAIIKWLTHNRREGATTDAIDRAAANGHIRVVQWLHIHRNDGCTAMAMDHAARNGFLDMVIWLHTNRSEGCTVHAINGAATEGHLHMVIWLLNHRSEGCTSLAMDGAASNGYVAICELLRLRNSCFIIPQGFRTAVIRGDLHTVRWIATHYEVDLQLVHQWSQRHGWTQQIIEASFY